MGRRVEIVGGSARRLEWMGRAGVGLGLWAAALSAGCAGGGGIGKPLAQFPSREELQDIAEREAKPVAPLKTVEVDRWQMTPPLPEPGAEYPLETAWDRALLESTKRNAGRRPAVALRCAAQEIARFYVQHAGYPEDSLRDYLLLRCGSTLPGTGLTTLNEDVPESVSDSEIERGFRPSLEKMLDAAPFAGEGQGEVGLGYARGNGRVSVVYLGGMPQASLKGFTPLVDAESVNIEGRIERAADHILGFVNYGPYGVRMCEPSRRVRAPRFELRCPFSAEDELARIEITTRRADQVLMNVAVEALVRRSDDVGLFYEPPELGSREPSRDAESFRSSLFEALNGVRRSAGLGALGLESAQSLSNQKVTAQFFEAHFENDEDLVDRVALGLLAGWDVRGMIRDGGIYSGVLVSARSPGRFLESAMASPIGRWVLLEPGMTRVAIGAGRLPPSGIMALLTTYAFFGSTDHAADETAVFEELGKARKARGAPAPRRRQTDAALTQALSRIANNQLLPDEALSQALTQISEREKRSVSGLVMETTDLKGIELNEDLLRSGPLELAIGVTHYKAPGAAWGQYAILFAVLQ